MFSRILALFDASVPRTELPPADAKYALGALMVRTAMVDNTYLFQEIEEIDRVLGKLYDLGPVEAAKMRAQCEVLEQELPRNEDLTEILMRNINAEKRERTVRALWDVVYADGTRDPEQTALLREIAALIGIDEQSCERLRLEQKARHLAAR
ncbi:TerB family tellurite resistance protein [Marivita sp. GX14005]|uniref:tellurite resistance TerB family protein n=1 Tax=Marivita sp. GX14005 TaxID=2942276 RepID=UPI002019230C|nr:TerB family tellurite resistance protein [Marivita sp. GX14005]MCL3881542.1 TerB family tellurite resistance protein [Marivita sp. GX14005]